MVTFLLVQAYRLRHVVSTYMDVSYVDIGIVFIRVYRV